MNRARAGLEEPFLPYPTGDAVARARELVLGGERVRVVEAGQASGDPVLLLHGWGASAYSFRWLLPVLAREGFRAIAPDLRGHGWSAKPVAPDAYTASAMVGWVRALLDALGVGRALIVGQSLGGAIALDASIALPDRVQAAVLLAPIGFTPIGRVALARALGVSRWPAPQTPRWLVSGILDRIYGDRLRWTERDVDEYWQPLRARETRAALLRLVAEFDFSPRVPGSIQRLVIRFGERDRLIPWAAASNRAGAWPGADVSVIPGAAHVPAEEAPEESAAAIFRAAGRR